MSTARTHVSATQRHEWSVDIAKRAESILQWSNIGRIHSYRSAANLHEPDTAWVEAYIYGMWPSIELVMGQRSRRADMPEGLFDVIFVPLLAYDESCNRLGMGGGWYDRFLATQPQSVVIGLGFELQCVPTIPVEPHDIPLDYVVTEHRVIRR